jgi:predicted RNA-binding Zn ribbon-like protein
MDLPADLELPLRSGQGYWYWLGGRPAVDFVNTLRERWWREVETLVNATDLTNWLAEADLLAAGSKATATRVQLLEARRLREAIDAGLRTVVGEEAVPASAIRTLNQHLPASQVGESLIGGTAGVPLLVPVPHQGAVAHALGLIAHDAAVLLGTEERRRARICESPTCSARFYDLSPAGRRRWCSMRGCGNAAKARRHRERARAAA